MSTQNYQLTCPACGSSTVVVSTGRRMIAAPLGPGVSVDVEVDTCGSCGERGDFAKRNDERIKSAEKQSATASVDTMLESLTRRECTMAYMERALSLPTRTIARWKAGDGISAPAITLLRMIATYPWLLEVADARYAPSVASSRLVIEAGKAIGNAIHMLVIPASLSNVAASQAVEVTITRATGLQAAHLVSVGGG